MTKDLIILVGGLALLTFFIWYLAAINQRTRLRVGLALWLTAIAVFAFAIYPPKETIRLGLDLQGGVSFTMELAGQPSENALQQAVGVIRQRVDQFGVAEPIIQPVGDRRIVVQMPGIDEVNKAEVERQLQRVAKLEFRLVHPNSDSLVAEWEEGNARIPLGYVVMTNTEPRAQEFGNQILFVSERVELEGKYVDQAYRAIGQMGEPIIQVTFDSEGTEKFGKLTSEHVGEQMAILLDGQLKSAPVIREPIFGTCQISGNFTPEEAQELASTLENPLETPVNIIEKRDVNPTLGQASIERGVQAGLAGTILVLLFTVFYYRVPGLIACVSLAVNALMLVGLLAQLGFTLTLPGIAGMALTIGMAIDANVLIYERLREELAIGKPVTAAIASGFDKAFSSIIDANITTIITSIILFYMGSGPVQGFAVTITLGIVGTLFAALIATRNMFEWLDHRGTFANGIHMMQFVDNPQFDFMKHRFTALAASLLLLIAGLGYFVLQGDKALGVDFTGGDAVTLDARQAVDLPAVRAALDGPELRSAFVQAQQPTSDESKLSLVVRTRFGDGEKVLPLLTQAFPDAGFTMTSIDKVGPVVGNELKEKSFVALLLGVLGILAYVTWRFEFSFALATIVALVHDVAITIGIMALLGQEMSLIVVGAVLALAGYSVNDTIVVFDRVREALRGPSKDDLLTLLNDALNRTLSRTLLTSSTTLLTILTLCIWGGPVLFPFALALFIGIVLGTYSTIFIACPIVLWWTRGRVETLRRQLNQQPTRAIPV